MMDIDKEYSDMSDLLWSAKLTLSGFNNNFNESGFYVGASLMDVLDKSPEFRSKLRKKFKELVMSSDILDTFDFYIFADVYFREARVYGSKERRGHLDLNVKFEDDMTVDEQSLVETINCFKVLGDSIYITKSISLRAYSKIDDSDEAIEKLTKFINDNKKAITKLADTINSTIREPKIGYSDEAIEKLTKSIDDNKQAISKLANTANSTIHKEEKK